jgi:hypothetical protein
LAVEPPVLPDQLARKVQQVLKVQHLMFKDQLVQLVQQDQREHL